MLAYTQKMRRISSDRLSLAATGSSSPSSNAADPVLPPAIGQGFRTLERLLVLSKTGQPSPCFEETDIAVSADSEADLVKDNEGKDSDRRRNSSVDPPPKLRPASFHTLESTVALGQSRVLNDYAEENEDVPGGPNGSRQRRRPGTTEKPDVLALSLSMQKIRVGSGESRRDASKDSSSFDESSDASLAITPFPEFKVSSSMGRVDEDAGGPFATDNDEDRLQGASSRTSEPSRKRSTKAKENYWGFKRSQPRPSLSVTSSNAFSKSHSQPDRSSSPRHITPRLIRKQLKAKPPPPKKTYHHSFRYSDAVENVIRSVDESKTDKVFENAVRRASEILPTLDIKDLRLERKRMREDTHKTWGEAARDGETPSSDTQTTDECDGNDAPVVQDAEVAVSRERSLSAPDILSNQEVGGCSKEGEKNELGIKSLLRKFDDAYFNNVPPRKTVQFLLPSSDSESESRDE